MKNKIVVILSALLISQAFIGCADMHHDGTGKPPSSHAYTPPKGSAERTAIIDATRHAMEKQDPTRKVVLVVPYLKVHNGWAWIQVNPQSPDGTQHYESQSGLLQKKSGKWVLLEWMPAEEGLDQKTYFKNLRKKYPSAPADIFPK